MKDIEGKELKVGDYVLYCEAGRGSSSSIQVGTVSRMTPKTVMVKHFKHNWGTRQTQYSHIDLYKITKEVFDNLLINK